MSTDTLLLGPERPAGALLGAAVGDALGWPQEDRSRIVGGNVARQIEPTPEFRAWLRSGGTRFASYEDPVARGEYSDDTQLMLAVARACLRGPGWLAWLTATELPQWTLYERGGGGAVLRAARLWAKGRAPWDMKGSKDMASRRRYFDAGGNGVAMRIAPHAILATYAKDSRELFRRIIADGLATHGHPHALVGAALHGQALHYALSKEGTLEYGELLHNLLDAPMWADGSVIEEVAAPEWPLAYRANMRETDTPSFELVWAAAVNETIESLQRATKSLSRGAMANDQAALEEIGCFDRRKSGAGTVAAVAAAYVTSRSASRPISGLLRTAFLHGADTDTIASMTGSLLGGLHGTTWLGGLGKQVQDRRYLFDMATQLSALTRAEDWSGIGSAASSGTVAVTEATLRDFTRSLTQGHGECRLPDERSLQVLDQVELSAKGNSSVTRVIAVTEDGQTIVVDRVSRNRSDGVKRPQARGQQDLFTAQEERQTGQGRLGPGQTPRILRTELRAADLARSIGFYRDLLGLSLEKQRGDLLMENGLFITQGRTTSGSAGNRSLVLTVAHPALEELAQLADAAGAHPTWADDRSALWLRDPDGNSVRVTRLSY